MNEYVYQIQYRPTNHHTYITGFASFYTRSYTVVMEGVLQALSTASTATTALSSAPVKI